MKKLIVLFAAATMGTACHKTETPPAFVCNCSYRYSPVKDTTVNYPMSAGASKAQAQTECNARQEGLIASFGQNTTTCQLR